MCGGDFNEVLYSLEKKEGFPKAFKQMQGFREVVDLCGFQHMGFEGYPFTWSNGLVDSDNIQLRLDRALAIESFIQQYVWYKVIHGQRLCSNHCLLLIQIEVSESSVRRNRRPIFIFEECWTREIRCEDAIREV